jgi:parvulin-like peptidyl-prolyl isomerase
MKLYSRKPKKNPIKILILITILVGLGFAMSKQFSKKNINDIVVAQIGEENIYKSDIDKKIKEVLLANNKVSDVTIEKLSNQVIELFAREIYLDKKIVEEAKKIGLDNNKDFKESIENYKVLTLRQLYVDNITKDSLTDEKIVEKFNEMNSKFENTFDYKFQQIVVRDELQINEIFKELKSKKPIKFADAIRKYSVDTQSAYNVGQVDFKSENLILKEVLDNLKIIKNEEISKPFRSGEFWYIVKLIDSKKSKTIEFESAKEYIKHILKIEEIEKINGNFIKDQKVKILIKRDETKEVNKENDNLSDDNSNPSNIKAVNPENTDATSLDNEANKPLNAKTDSQPLDSNSDANKNLSSQESNDVKNEKNIQKNSNKQ